MEYINSKKRNLIGIESHQKFYHVNTKHTYDQIFKIKIY